ncbi:MAG TPA: ABC-F family ATP-binding cassette domain-containing protein [Micromonosporaceae bacterium]
MSATLVARGLQAAHGDRVLFSDLDLVVGPGDVIGLVGANGAGKSTVLRILAGQRPPDAGTVTLNPPTGTVGYLPQETVPAGPAVPPLPGPGETVGEYLARRTGVADATRHMDSAAQALAEGGSQGGVHAQDAYAAALERWLALGGADLPDRIDAVLADLGLTGAAGGAWIDRPMTALSGGQAARASLAALLLSRYDVYLLDEPTNDLDLSGLTRLEQFVADLHAPTVLVSHDREFLARTVTSVVELDLAQQQVNHYGGGYLSYLDERALSRVHARRSYEEYAQTKARLAERARTQRAWAEKGVRNARRKASDNDKSVRHFHAETSEKQAAKARATDRLIERLEVVDEPRKEWELRMTIASAPRAGAVVAILRDAVVRRPPAGEAPEPGATPFVLGPVSLQIDWADRVGIVGANGSGKSTLLAALLGRIPLEAGHRYLGPGVVVGEVDQARALFHGTDPLVDAFRHAAPDSAPADVRTLLAKFGLRSEHVLRPAATLSAGERTRAALALLQAKGVNLLVLDEPTNHLDLPAIEQLESALASYPGTLLLVTHDRRMLDAVRLTRLITLHEIGQISETQTQGSQPG